MVVDMFIYVKVLSGVGSWRNGQKLSDFEQGGRRSSGRSGRRSGRPCPPEHEALLGGVFHGQIGGDDGENSLGIARRDRAGDHPDIAAARIKVRVRPDACVRG